MTSPDPNSISPTLHLSNTQQLPKFVRVNDEALHEEALPRSAISSSVSVHHSQIPPIRRFSTRQFPCPPSTTSFHDDRHNPSFTESEYQIRSNLRASIAKLELLIHEATSLAKLAAEQERPFEGRDAHGLRSDISPTFDESDLVPVEPAPPQVVVKKRPQALQRNIQTTSSLRIAGPVVAPPVLTLSKSASFDEIFWKEPVIFHEEHQDSSDNKPKSTIEDKHHVEVRPCPPQQDCSTDDRQADASRTSITEDAAFQTMPIDHHIGIILPPSPHLTPDNPQPEMELVSAGCNPPQIEEPRELAVGIPVIILDPAESVTKRHESELARPDVGIDSHVIVQEGLHTPLEPQNLQIPRVGHERHFSNMFGMQSRQISINLNHPEPIFANNKIDLRQKSYVDVYNKGENFDVHDTCYHATVARNWPNGRKRFTAVITCINTGCIGFLIGVYAGEVPAIQYAIADLKHYSILGNVVMYCGLAMSTLIFWPLPLLHGRKPYIIAAQICALALQLPQGLAVTGFRDPGTALYRCLLLVSRGLSGLVLGFVDINSKSTLLDLFGASLQSQGAFTDAIALFDVRKHGGGMGIWLGLLAWSTIGPISIGFMVGASIVNQGAPVYWGFWISLMVLMFTLLLNVISPEVRRSAFRRTVSELIGEAGEFSRVTRGEIKMHLNSVGPYWWGEEVSAGLRLCGRMILQPGFLSLAIYTGWIYAQYSLVLMLLGALTSKHYKFTPAYVGTCSLALAFGAGLAIPFQKASLFSRARSEEPRTDSFTMQKRLQLSSHLVRRILFMTLLPLSAAAYAGASLGPPLSVSAPCSMAGLVGFFTTMATSECYGLIMETFDTTDLQPGMTGRPLRGSVDERFRAQRTNFSCYPRVSAAFIITQVFSYVFAAAATAVCGRVERREGTVWATTGVAIILSALTVLLILVLVKWKKVQMVPDGAETDLDHLRRVGTSWRPIILGRSTGKHRRLSILEMGSMTRFSEIRQRNRVEGQLSGGLRL